MPARQIVTPSCSYRSGSTSARVKPRAQTNVVSLTVSLSLASPARDTGPVFSYKLYRRLRIGRDEHLDQSKAYDIP